MAQEVGVGVVLLHIHQLEAQVHLHEHFLADVWSGSQGLEVLSSQSSEPPENFLEPPESALLQNQRQSAL